VNRAFEFLDVADDENEVDIEQFDRKSVRREREYKISKSSKCKKKAFKKVDRY
jgi:hypothetical protein